MDPRLQEAHDQAYIQKDHYLRSANASTKCMMSALLAARKQLLHHVKDGDLSANGVEWSQLEAKAFAWLDGMSRRIGDKPLCAVMLGSLRRAVETLKRELRFEVKHVADP